jgi:TonB family protein
MKYPHIFTLRIFLIAIGFFATSYSHASEEWLAKFAKDNDGKFTSEVSSLPKRVVVRSKPFDGWWTFSEYDQKRKILRNSYIGTVRLQSIYEKCIPIGSFIGSNAYGAKANVQRSVCERLEIQNDAIRGLDIGSLEIEMSPQQFRDLKSKGPVYEIEFEVGKDVKQEVASIQTIYSTATISDRNQKKIQVLRINGKFEILRILTPDGKTILHTIENTSSQENFNQLQSSGIYSSGYMSRIIGRIKPNISFIGILDGNLESDIELTVTSSGVISNYNLVNSSGNSAWDNAVLRAIGKTEVLPKDIDGKVPSLIRLKFTNSN